MPRIYTEIRIPHESREDKEQYEAELDKALKRISYSSRAEWLRQCVRDAIYEAKRLDAETEYINNGGKGYKK